MWLSAVRCTPVLLGASGEPEGHAGPSSGDSAQLSLCSTPRCCPACRN